MHKARRKSLIIIAALLLISILIGCAAESVIMRSSQKEYTKQYLEVANFSSWEFEDRGNNTFYALANNSYFLIEGLGGVPVDHVHLDLSVTPEDTTTKTLYFYGIKDGVEGEFVVPLERDEDAFSARLRAESVEYIRFYPTQRVRTTIEFSGMTLNDRIESGQFSWASAAAVAVMAFGVILFFIKLLRRTEVSWVFTCGALLVSLMAAAGSFAKRMFTAAQAIGDILPVITALAGAAVYAVVVLYVRRADTFAKKVFWGILTVSLLFCFVTAPLQLPDETSHFLRTYSLSQGTIRYDYNDEYPNDLKLLYDYFPAEFYNHVQSDGRGNVPGHLIGYLNAVSSGAVSGNSLHTSLQITLPYILPAAAVAVVRVVGGNALFCLWAARIVNALIYSFAAGYALKKASRYEVPLLIALAAPIALSMAGSVSYDAMFLAAFAVFAGTLLAEKIEKRDIVFAVIAYAVMIMIKPIYLPFMFLVFAADRQSIGMKRIWVAVIMAAAGIALWAASQGLATLLRTGIQDPVYPEGVDYMGQILFILKNPVKYFVIALVDGYENSFYINKWGLFGTLDVHGYLTTVLAPASVAVCTLISGEKKKIKRDPWVFGILSAGMYVLIVTGFYVIWSTLGSTSILGVQARYFIPTVFTLSAFTCSVIRPLEDKERALNISAYILIGFALLGAAEVFLQYYLM